MNIENSGPNLLSFQGRSRNWLQRLSLTLLGITLAALAFFFITIVLVAGSVLAIAIAVRWWWLVRRLRAAQKAAAPLEGEYTVLEHGEDKKIRS